MLSLASFLGTLCISTCYLCILCTFFCIKYYRKKKKKKKTVHCAGSGSGERLPLFILYKGKNLYQRWMEGGPAAAVYGISESGWMDGANFLSWFTKLFLPAVPYLTETAPVLLFLDGHHSHISLELIRRARGNNILLLCLPPNTTHLLQPLDVGVFAPMKSAWRAILKRYKLETKGQQVGKEVFPSLIAKLWDTSFIPQQCKGGFRGAGLVPFSCEHVLQKLAPSAVAVHHDPENEPDDRQATTKITCTSCGHQMATTPVLKTCNVSYFSGILDVWTDTPKIGKRNNLKVRVEGEVITSNEFVDLLEEQKASKEAEKKQKKGKRDNRKEGTISLNVRIAKMPRRVSQMLNEIYTHSNITFSCSPTVDENICQECGVSYDEDDHQDAWIGCDNEDTCGRWFHYWCAGFDRKPRAHKKFICSYCLNKDK